MKQASPKQATATTSESRPLRLGAYGLSDAIVRHLGVLLRFLEHQNTHPWQFVDQPPMDLVVTTPEARPDLPATLSENAISIVEYGREADHARSAHELPRHFRSRHLEDVLKVVEAAVGERRVSPVQTPVARKPSKVETSAKVEVAPIASSSLFKLLRWPPAAIVRRDPVRTRLASMLTRAPISVEQMATRSGQPAQVCLDFIHALQSVGLIETTQQGQLEQQPVPQQRKSLAAGLISSLRRHLGLAR